MVCVQQARVQLVKEGPSASVKETSMEMGTDVAMLDERVSALNHEKDVLLRNYVEARVVKVRDSKSLFSLRRHCSAI